MSHSSNIPQVPRSKTHQGYFGRIFPHLTPPSFSEEQLKELALAMYRENREDSAMPAGYTYFGQFVSHDITFDPTSKLDRINDPEMLNNFRTPRFDLDSIYGRGPEDHPYLYGDVDELNFDFEIKLSGTNIGDCTAELLEEAKKKIIKANIITGINKNTKDGEGKPLAEEVIFEDVKWDKIISSIERQGASYRNKLESAKTKEEKNYDIINREIHITITGRIPDIISNGNDPQIQEGRGEDLKGMGLHEKELEALNLEALQKPELSNNRQELVLNRLVQQTLELLAQKAVFKTCATFLVHIGLDSQNRQLKMVQPDLSLAKSCEALTYLAAYSAVKVLIQEKNGATENGNLEEEWLLILMNKVIEIVTSKVKTFAVTLSRGSMTIGKGEKMTKNKTIEPDLPRINGKAIIGDPRNDVNTLIAQLHLCFLKFHNEVIKILAIQKLAGKFEGNLLTEARRVVTWHYQWVVIHDFLKRLVGKETLYSIISPPPTSGNLYDQSPEINLKFYQWSNNAYIPVEFSAAAYRFGHSIIRSTYKLNDQLKKIDFPVYFTPSLDHKAFEKGVKGLTQEDAIKIEEEKLLKGGLRGKRQLPLQWSIQWDYFLQFEEKGDAANLQFAKKINPYLAPELGQIPIALDQEISLTEKNLLRGLMLSLPTGQQIARMMGLEPITFDSEDGKKLESVYKLNKINLILKKYKLSKINDLSEVENLLDELKPVGGSKEESSKNDAKRNECYLLLKDVVDSPVNFQWLSGKMPLWYYILAEAETVRNASNKNENEQNEGLLGPLGGRIVAEVFLGLLSQDPNAYWNIYPTWTPHHEQVLKIPVIGEQFELRDIVAFAKMPINNNRWKTIVPV